MGKLIGYARVSTDKQDTDRQEADLLAAGVQDADLYLDKGISGARASRPRLDAALAAAQPGDTFVVCTLDRLGRSTVNMLDLATRLQNRDIALRVLNLGGGVVDTRTATGRMLFTIMAALAEMELEIKRERIQDSVRKRRATGGNLGGRKQTFTDAQIRAARDLVAAGQRTVTEAARDLGMGRTTYYARVAELNARQAAETGTTTGPDYYTRLGELDAETATMEGQ